MARATTYTQAQLESAKQALDSLPDLRANKIQKAVFLESLKEQIVSLSVAKGYTIPEIKSALETVGVTVTVKAISELLKTSNGKRRSKLGTSTAK